jgi:hypothetical protein
MPRITQICINKLIYIIFFKLFAYKTRTTTKFKIFRNKFNSP